MKKSKTLKKYFVTVTWYPQYAAVYDDAFDVWAINKEQAIDLIHKYYGSMFKKLLKNKKKNISIKVYYKPFSTFITIIRNKVPKKAFCKHI